MDKLNNFKEGSFVKTPKAWRRLLAGVICLMMLCSVIVPAVHAEESAPVSLTANARVSAYTIADPANYYNNNASKSRKRRMTDFWTAKLPTSIGKSSTRNGSAPHGTIPTADAPCF